MSCKDSHPRRSDIDNLSSFAVSVVTQLFSFFPFVLTKVDSEEEENEEEEEKTVLVSQSHFHEHDSHCQWQSQAGGHPDSGSAVTSSHRKMAN